MKSHEKKVSRKGSSGTTIFEEPFTCGTCGISNLLFIIFFNLDSLFDIDIGFGFIF